MAKLNKLDLKFILEQIIISEQHAKGGVLFDNDPNTPNLIASPQLSFGLRTVDGTYNNLLPGQEEFGASDNLFPRLLDAVYRNEADDSFTADTNGPAPGGVETLTNNDYSQMGTTPVTPGSFFVSGDVADADPRIISNLNANQSISNPAAVQTYVNSGLGVLVDGVLHHVGEDGQPGAVVTADESLFIANVAPDEGLSAPFNSWMTLFGQFFDHGLDLVTKGDNGTIYIPLQPDDPLYVEGGRNFMTVTRVTVDANGEATNTTTSWVDQNQTYTSHASHQAWLREYVLDSSGKVVATGHLLEGVNGGLATWADIKAQARDILGFNLTDADVTMVPMLAVDQYGRLLLDSNGKAQIVTGLGGNGTQDHTGFVDSNGNYVAAASGDDAYTSGVPGSPVSLAGALRFGHAFLDDIAHTAGPYFDHDRNPNTPSILATADANGTAGGSVAAGEYDNELLDAHYITGDGRGNENIGLTAVHHVFHSEHNRQAEEIKQTILTDAQDMLAGGSTQAEATAFLNEWLLTDVTTVPANLTGLNFDGERIFQAARFATEMQYQHLVFEEFGRKVMPGIDVFAGIQTDIDAAIVAEFAHVVYRFGHSMLTETVDRIDANGNPVLSGGEQMGLIEAFLNPLAYAARETEAGAAAGEIVNGMTRQVGNEIDQFVTGALQNNLLGLPLDLAAINMARAREAGIPSLNAARRQFFDMTGDSQLQAYTSWNDFGANLKYDDAVNKGSLVNFIAAYGTHSSITSATTMADKRAAAELLVYGNRDVDGDGIVDVAPADRLQFMNSTGAWASGAGGVTTTGLDVVDFWIGGLAERQMPFGGLLGSTFGFVFETQMEMLQDGDRLYYLARTAGLNFLSELEGNSFAELIMRNTPNVGHLPGDIFSTPNFILELDQSKQFDYDPDSSSLDPVGQVVRNNPATPGPDSNYLEFNGGEHVVLGGTNGNDILIADIGDDTVWGDGGNDRIEGGAGNDILNGGDGDDIITDSFGDDNIKGGAGNDVINAGAGIDLIIAGDGHDFVVAGSDEKETIAGEGNDFILGSNSFDTIFGGGGDDWMEGGNSADLLQGDNGDPFQNSQISGNDVVIGGGGNDDYDMESGDDIGVAGQGTERYEGMFGYDWVTNRGNADENGTPIVVDDDLLINLAFIPDTPEEALRDRFDRVEGLSGWDGDDTLRGDNAGTAELTATDPASGQNNELTNIALINGLQGLLDGMLGAGQTSFSGGNILLGGGGSDTIEGRGGDDLIDGDKWLNVQISYVDANNVEHRVDSMADIQAQMFAGTLNPGQLRIVREIVQANGTGDTDTAIYNDIEGNYTITRNELNGTWTITDDQPLIAGPDIGIFAQPTDEGTDTIRNIEQLRFSDGAGGFVTVSLDPFAANQAATGTITLSSLSPVEDQTMSVTDGVFSDFNGSVNQATLQYDWQAQNSNGDWITVLSNSATFTPTNAQTGQALRVVARFEDNMGNQESVISDVTAAVQNVDDAPTSVDTEVIIVEDGSHTFSAADFGFSDPDDGDSLGSVVINTLPLTGSLTLSGNPVVAGAIITAAQIGSLVYTPAANANGEDVASLNFTVRDADGTAAAASSTVWFSVNTANDAPEGTNNAVTIAEDTSYTFTVADFGFTDIDADDTLRGVRIDSVPAAGSLLLNGNLVNAGDLILAPAIAAGDLKFTPDPDQNGYPNQNSELTNFTFSVQDLAQDFDATPNTMTINVNQVNDVATGAIEISDPTPTEGTAISVSELIPIADIDGLGALAYQWQSSADGINGWVNVAGATAASFNPTQAVVNRYLRVSVSFTDGDGNAETITSPVTTLVVGDLYNGTSAANNRTLTNGEDVANGLGGNDVLNGLGGNDILNGGAGSDTLNGGDGDDILIGGDGTGADTLIGGAGVDTMTGGAGNDTYEVDNELDVVNENAGEGTDTIDTSLNAYSLAALANVENLSFSGDGNFEGTGNTAVNRIEGGDGNDRLDGLAGNDVLIGGLGDDTYVVTQQGEVVELADEGIDTIESSVTYSLASTTAVGGVANPLANVENLTLTGAGNINGTGNALANVITGNSGNNTLIGGAGNDTLFGGEGTNIIRGGADNDTMYGGTGNDVFDSTSATGTINGEALGADTMTGGAGNDNYAVDNIGDVVVELAGEGTDIIRTSLLSFDLSTNGINVENLSFLPSTRTESVTGIGNNLNNVITGAAGNDFLTGNAGNDTLNGGVGNDTFIATVGDGNDTYNGGTNGLVGLTVGNFTNIIGDWLDMSQTTLGVSVTTTTASGAEIGSDTLSAIENFIGGSGSDTINVNGAANYIDGGAGVDTINAGGGNDIIIGGLGNDFLNGGTGFDTFVFGLNFGNDTINGPTAGERFDAVGTGSLLDQDLLDIRGLGITDFNTEVSITGDATNTLVTIGANTIQLVGVNVADVTQQDFIVS